MWIDHGYGERERECRSLWERWERWERWEGRRWGVAGEVEADIVDNG